MASDKFSKNGWERLAEVRSESNPSKWYIIGRRTLATGKEQIGCSCPGWTMGNKEGTKAKGCKHVVAFLAGKIPQYALQMTPHGCAWLAAKSFKVASVG